MFRKLVIFCTPLLVLSGCMSKPPYSCRLGETNDDCHTMQQVYGKSKSTPGQTGSLEQIMRPDPSHTVPLTPPSMPVANRGSAYAEPGEVGRPVFKEPQVHRVWIAPYVDANGNLRSGEYTYFSTPGEWNYGSTTVQGNAAAGTMFAPVKGGNTALGFNANIKNTAAPSAPKQAPPKPQDSNFTSLTPSTQVPAITPPAQKFSE